MKKLNPKCIKRINLTAEDYAAGYDLQLKAMAITNQGCLIPCCYLDNRSSKSEIKLKELLKVSNINDYDDLNDITKTAEWKNWYNDLINDKSPSAMCLEICGTKTKGRTDVQIDTKTNKKIKEYQK